MLIQSDVEALPLAVLADVELPLMLPPIAVYHLILTSVVPPSLLSVHSHGSLLLVAPIRGFASALIAASFNPFVLSLNLRAFDSTWSGDLLTCRPSCVQTSLSPPLPLTSHSH